MKRLYQINPLLANKKPCRSRATGLLVCNKFELVFSATIATVSSSTATIVTGRRDRRCGWRRGRRRQRDHAGITVDHRVDLVETALGKGRDRRVERRRHDELTLRRGRTFLRAVVRSAEHMADLVRGDERIQRGAVVSHGDAGGKTLAAEPQRISDARGVAVQLAAG